jgi:hypothetical protein
VHFLEPLTGAQTGTPSFDAVVGMLNSGTAYSLQSMRTSNGEEIAWYLFLV